MKITKRFIDQITEVESEKLVSTYDVIYDLFKSQDNKGTIESLEAKIEILMELIFPLISKNKESAQSLIEWANHECSAHASYALEEENERSN